MNGHCLTVRLLVTLWERLRGLLGTEESAKPVMLVHCGSIHTFGMRYALDVALASRDGRVLRSKRQVPPGRVVSCRGAFYALERPAQKGPWPQEGDEMKIGTLFGDDGQKGVLHE